MTRKAESIVCAWAMMRQLKDGKPSWPRTRTQTTTRPGTKGCLDTARATDETEKWVGGGVSLVRLGMEGRGGSGGEEKRKRDEVGIE